MAETERPDHIEALRLKYEGELEAHRALERLGCVDCGQPMRGEVLRECANPACPMYGGPREEEEATHCPFCFRRNERPMSADPTDSMTKAELEQGLATGQIQPPFSAAQFDKTSDVRADVPLDQVDGLRRGRDTGCQIAPFGVADSAHRPGPAGFGVTVYVGPGYVFHLSTEDGFQSERAPHRTWRLGAVLAVRR